MCGICGVIQLRGEPRPVLPPGALEAMTDVMTHRGPNDRGTFEEPGVALGVRRLSIVDVEGGHQPFANEDGSIWAIQNGELYNHAELRAGLAAAGHRFTSRCDTEVIPHLYERDDVGLCDGLRGMFGLAVWDRERRRGVVARDRLGIKPLYYAHAGDCLVFASELKCVLASGLVPLDLDYEALDAYLALGFVPAPLTPLAAVRKLPPGHLLLVDGGDVEVRRYWSYPRPAPRRDLAFEACADELRERLEESVRLRLMSDVPLGAMLSGGLDSSLVTALMARNMSEPVKTFAVGFREAGAGNELADARAVAAALGADHHEVELSFAEQTVDLAELVWYMDEPVADLSALGFLALSRLAAQHVTVALSGQGADELFGGYAHHRNAAVASWFDRLPSPLRAGTLRAARLGPAKAQRAADLFGERDSARRTIAMRAMVDADTRARLRRGPLAATAGDAAAAAVRERLGRTVGDRLAESLYLDGQLALADDMLHYFDRASMACSLEVRVPFLDHHVVEFSATIPPAYKVARLRTKAVLKEAARGLVPSWVIDKPKVGFFNAAVGAWFRAQAGGAIPDYLLGSSPRYAEFLERSDVEELVAANARGALPNGNALLAILMLEVWLATFVPRARSAAAAPSPIAA